MEIICGIGFGLFLVPVGAAMLLIKAQGQAIQELQAELSQRTNRG